MKTRNGFVSNSSTSSFCIFGARFGSFPKVEGLPPSEEPLEEGEEDEYDLEYRLEKFLEPLGLRIWSPEDAGYYIGASWPSIKDDETGAQFKDRIKRTLVEVIGKDVECHTHSEAWYS